MKEEYFTKKFENSSNISGKYFQTEGRKIWI